MNECCSICLQKETFSDFVEGTTFTDVENKTYCATCFDKMEDTLFFCDRCYKIEHKNDQFVTTTDINNDMIYYHINCLRDDELCIICKKYLQSEECINMFIDYNCKIECCHKNCITDNYSKYDICHECGISMLVKCENCNRRFRDCYNKECANYGYDMYREPGRYDGYCETCNW